MGRRQTVGVGDPLVRCRAPLANHPLRQHARRLHVGNVVHQVQGLQRCISPAEEDDAALTRRRIERQHRRRPQRALPEGVEATAIQVASPGLLVFLATLLLPEAFRLVRPDRRPADLCDEQPRNRERLVADHLRRQTQTRSTSQQAVLGVCLQLVRSKGGLLAVGGARHDRPVYRLDVPAGIDEGRRQPVEQLRMARILSLHSEVVGRLDQTRTEVHLPEAVHGDPGGERVAGLDEPAGEP